MSASASLNAAADPFAGWMTLAQAARLYDVGQRRLQGAAARGALPHRTIGEPGKGSITVVHVADVARYLGQKRPGPAPQSGYRPA